MVPQRIQNYLHQRRVRYHAMPHKRSLTAQGTAARTHISGRRFAKTVVVKQDGRYFMCVIPANEMVDLGKLRGLLGGMAVETASEEELERLFPDCECGAMPPLGGLYGIPVVADECLCGQAAIAVNGGTHTDVLEMRWEDFVRAENPIVMKH